jgi:putative acetyltransferase
VRNRLVDIRVRDEHQTDYDAVRSLHTLAFGDDGQVARLVDALRIAKAPLPPLSFVATVRAQVTGHVMLSASRLDARRRLVDVYVLSPLGVLPAYQRNGIGTQLVRHAIGAADARGAPLVFLEGSARFYGTRGFDRADTAGFRSPSLRIPPPAFQVVRLSRYEQWMSGTLVYSETFWAQDCVGLRDPALSRLCGLSPGDTGGQ